VTREYRLQAQVGPKPAEVIRFVVERHINSRIGMATVEYLDKNSRMPVNDLRVDVSPVSVPTPEYLASKCFSKASSRDAAKALITSFSTKPTKMRTNGVLRLSVYAGSKYRVVVRHPLYHYRDDVLQMHIGEMTRVMRDIGSKVRVRQVRD